MASVTSLDGDLRRLRLEKYTPAAANEAKSWIESILGERLPNGDLLDALKDGVALCKLVNLVIGPPGVKFKKSGMPFVQMENISHFIRACQAPPLNLQQHDMFLTVDLYERKDPAQVLQCIGAFSRAANNVSPDSFPTSIGPKAKPVLSPEATGYNTGYNTPPGLRGRASSNSSSNTSSLAPKPSAMLPSHTGGAPAADRWGPTKSPTGSVSSSGNGRLSPGVSTWSRREHEGATSPAWNIAQYGYLGGASQGNLGIVYGGRRQITGAGPHVPSLAEKEKKRKEEAERARLEKEEEERRKQAEREAEEARAKKEEERRWEEETRRIREQERKKLEDEKRKWEEEERQWKIAEEKRRQEEEEAEARLRSSRSHKSDNKLRGQYLSQYQSDQEASDKERIRQLEMELEKARQREAEYERERQGRSHKAGNRGKNGRSRSRSRPADKKNDTVSRQDSWSVRDEQNFHSTAWYQREMDIEEEDLPSAPRSPRPLPDPIKAQRTGEQRPVPAPPVNTHRTGEKQPSQLPVPAGPVKSHRTGEKPLPVAPFITKQRTGSGGLRPLPQPSPTPIAPMKPQRTGEKQAKPKTPSPIASRTDRYLASNPAPSKSPPHTTYARELGGGIDERAEEDRKRQAAQTKTKAAGWASKSLLEREMELERQRQKEWEDAQKVTAKAVKSSGGVEGIGGGIGGRWDVGQWAGYTGGDSQNKGAQGIGAGRRQIVGPRPLPNAPR
ncbi:Transgelin [Cladorrhinum samala]|uniref:Transgelin n=1 Tax=Cladorrhinum samala TaxID=585594 RepID=A0AAV9HG54_9PEZI|nr:Transgelin [Cladorrhinum samala]